MTNQRSDAPGLFAEPGPAARFTRRNMMAGAAASGAALLLPGAVKAQALPPLDVMMSDRSLGRDDAPVTVIEFASLACSHCAQFHNNVFKDLKKKYIDTGKVRFIYRDFPTSPPQVSIGAAMIARCAPATRYFGMLEIFYHDQSGWFSSRNLLQALTASARKGGVSSETVQECLRQEPLLKSITEKAEEWSQKFGVRGTPSFVINGEPHRGGSDLASLSKAIDAALN